MIYKSDNLNGKEDNEFIVKLDSKNESRFKIRLPAADLSRFTVSVRAFSDFKLQRLNLHSGQVR